MFVNIYAAQFPSQGTTQTYNDPEDTLIIGTGGDPSTNRLSLSASETIMDIIGIDLQIRDFSSANGAGGAIFVDTGAVLTINTSNDGSVLFGSLEGESTPNQASSGGAIFSRGILNIDDNVIFRGNIAQDGGALTVRGVTTIGDNVQFISNQAIETVGSVRYFGGAIRNTDNLTIGKGVLFLDNFATTYGGAIRNGDSITFGDDAIFSRNITQGEGGAIYHTGDILTFGNNATFFNNQAGTQGGALYINGSNQAVKIGSNVSFTQNIAGQGPAIFINDSDIFFYIKDDKTSLFSGNISDPELATSMGIGMSGDVNITIQNEPEEIVNNGLLDMRDPMVSDNALNSVSINKNDYGTWALGGVSVLNSINNTNFRITDGTLYLYGLNEIANPNPVDPVAPVRAGEIYINSTNSNSFFIIDSLATLVAGGDNIISVTNGEISFSDGAFVRGGNANISLGGIENRFEQGGETSLTFYTENGAQILGTLNVAALGNNDVFTFNTTLTNGVGFNANVEKYGAGKVILTGDNLYTGNTVINEGTLQLGNGDVTGSVVSNILMSDNTSLIFDRDTDYEFQNDISGSGNVIKNNINTLTFSNNQSYDGPTTINSGTLEIKNDFSSNVTIHENATFLLNYDFDTTFNNTISGEGGIRKIGGGKLSLSSDNSFSGLTSINDGSIELISNGTISNAVIFNNEGSLIFNKNSPFTYSGFMTGSGSLIKQQNADLILTGNSSYSGLTTINSGTLQLGNGGETGSITSNVLLNNATLAFNRSDDIEYAGVISGNGVLNKNSDNQLILTGDSDFSGQTNINTGILQLGNGGATGGLQSDIQNDGSLIINRGNTFLYNGVISGTGDVQVLGTGIAQFSQAQNYSGVTVIDGGNMQLTDSGNIASSESVTINHDGVFDLQNLNGSSALINNLNSDSTEAQVLLGQNRLTINTTEDSVFDGLISGNGSLAKQGNAILTLTADNTYTNETEVFNGALHIGNGEDPKGSLNGNLINNTLVEFNNPGKSSFSNIISGEGDIVLNIGELTLNRENTYSGTTTVNNTGQLILEGPGSIGSSLQLNLNNSAVVNIGGVIDGTTVQNLSSDSPDVTVQLGDKALTIANTIDTSYAGSIIGIGELIKTEDGTFTFLPGSYNEANTSIVGGTLQINDGVDIANNITNDSIVQYNLNSSLLFPNIISGSGQLILQGDGELILTNDNTYTGDTLINGGVLRLGNGGATGSVSNNIINNGALSFNRSNEFIYNGIISGEGFVEKFGTGTLILTNNNTFTGNTVINAGQIQLGNNTTAGSINGFITNEGQLIFNRSNEYTFEAQLNGTGSIVKNGDERLIFTTPKNYLGNTYLNSGILDLSSEGAISDSASVILANSAALDITGISSQNASINNLASDSDLSNVNITDKTLIVSNNSDTTFGGVISGDNGNLTKNGNERLILSGSNTYNGITTINEGTLALSGNVGSITDSSSLILNNAAIFDISGKSSLTTIQNLFSESNAASIHLGANTLIINNSLDNDFEGVISGEAGSLTKQGQADLVLTGNNAYTGDTLIQEGNLSLSGNGSLANSSSITLESEASFSVNNINAASTTINNLMSDSTTSTITIGNKNLTINNTVDTHFSGNISGFGGSITKTGDNLLTLTGINNYTSGTTISAGTLQLGDGGTNGSITGDILNNSALIFNHSNDYLNSGVISGTGSLTQSGSGSLILANDNTHTGGTIISAGTLQLGNGGASGSVVGDITNNGALSFDRSDAYIYSDVISGTGSLTQSGSGSLILANDNTYTGDTVISSGTLQLGNGGASGSVDGDIINNGVLIFDRSDAYAYSNIISGGGALIQNGSGLLILTRDNTYEGNTAINIGSVLQLGNGGLSGSVDGNIIDNGLLIFNRQSDLEYLDIISGSGDVDKRAEGTQTFTNSNTYTGTTTISNGTLALSGSGSISDSSSVSLLANAIFNIQGISDNTVIHNLISDAPSTSVVLGNHSLEINNTSDTTFSGVISGNGGSITKSGNNVLTLTNDNTYTGGTVISSGTLQLGNGGTSGSVVGDITNNGALSFDRSDTYIYSDVISGTGSMTQSGSGSLILTNDNTYTGDTIVSNGTLALSGSGSIANSGTVLLNNASTLNVSNITDETSINELTSTSTDAQVQLGDNSLTVNSDNASSFSGVVSGTGSLTKSGASTLTLTNQNTYTGDTTINAGVLSLNGSGSISNSRSTTLAENTTLEINNATNGVTINDLSSQFLSSNIITGSKSLTVNQSNSLTFAGMISGNGGRSLKMVVAY